MERYHVALAVDQPQDAVLTEHKNITLTRKLFNCLAPGELLHDEVMNMYMDLLQVGQCLRIS